jgi:hypothetical protein
MIAKYWKRIVSVIVFIGATGAFLGNLSNFPAFISNFVPRDSTESDIYGIWLSKYSYRISGGVLDVNGTTEYFKNNSYNFIGEISIYLEDRINTLYIVYQADGTGTWRADSDSLTIRLEDLKTQPKSILHNGRTVDVYSSHSLLSEFPHIEDLIPSNITEEYKITNIDDDTITLEADTPNGDIFEITMKRQKNRFQRWLQ